MRPVLEGTAKSVCVSHDATDSYDAMLQKRLAGTIWTGCTSWYREGKNQDGRISAIFPGTVAWFWWLTRRPIWEHFNVVGGEAWARQRRRQWLVSRLKLLAGVAVLVTGVALRDRAAMRLPLLIAALSGVCISCLWA
jgi:hypothetical protein